MGQQLYTIRQLGHSTQQSPTLHLYDLVIRPDPICQSREDRFSFIITHVLRQSQSSDLMLNIKVPNDFSFLSSSPILPASPTVNHNSPVHTFTRVSLTFV